MVRAPVIPMEKGSTPNTEIQRIYIIPNISSFHIHKLFHSIIENNLESYFSTKNG